jgi:hypothetical protein
MDDKNGWARSRPISTRSTSHDIGTVEPVDLDLAGFLRGELQETSAAQRDEATMRAMGRRQLLDRNFGGKFVSTLTMSKY